MRTTRSRPIRRQIAAVLVLGLLLLACSVGDGGSSAELTSADFDDAAASFGEGGEDASPEETTATTVAAADVSEPSAASDEEALGSGGIKPAVLQTSDLGRDIIFTADLTVAVNDVGAAGQEATRLIEGFGGFLFGQQTTGSPDPRSILTFKVAPEDFQEALSRLGSIGELRTQNVSASDVTERIVDLESRINTATSSVSRLRTLLQEATAIEDIVELENELLERETELETLRGQLRTLEDQVALATIVLTLTEAATRPAIQVQVTAYPGHDDGLSCPGGSDLAVEQDSEVTTCFEIINTGDTHLTEFELRDPVLDIETEDVISVFGSPDATLEPGESIVVAAEIVAERNLRTQTQVTAMPVSEEGEELPDRPAASTVTMLIEAFDPGGIAGFTEGLEASWEVLIRLGQIFVLVLGALLPFFWVPVLLWLGWRLHRRSTTPVADTSAPAVEAE